MFTWNAISSKLHLNNVDFVILFIIPHCWNCFYFCFIFIFYCYCCYVLNSFAGTVGAIVTCPLEVVKTRLQSSSSTFYPTPITDIANKLNTNRAQFKGTTQKRDICTSILQKRSQVSVFCVYRLFVMQCTIQFYFSNYFNQIHSFL